ncbi:MAG: hypothetical protein HYZ72_00370 [Deltaproteobacteria bacterium]|nr:hypothetical protein [Deltaproteobacteria bacterium]
MKHAISPSLSLIGTLVLGLLVSGLLCAPSRSRAADLQDLDELASLEGNSYLAKRAQLLVEHPGLWDVSQAAAHFWGAGLAAHVLNGHLLNGPQFAEWEAFPVIRKEGPGFVSNPATQAGAAGQVFLIEQVWKTAPEPEIRDDAFNSLMRLAFEGPPLLWRAVFLGAAPGQVQAIGLHGVASDSSTTARNLLQGVLQDSGASQQLKIAALTGLGAARPPYATRLILDTLRQWQSDPELLGQGFAALAKQPDSRARETLHDIAQDARVAEDVRLTAVASFTDAPSSADRPVLQALSSGAVPEEIKFLAARALEIYDYLEVP